MTDVGKGGALVQYLSGDIMCLLHTQYNLNINIVQDGKLRDGRLHILKLNSIILSGKYSNLCILSSSQLMYQYE